MDLCPQVKEDALWSSLWILYHEDDWLPLFSLSEKGPETDSAQASALTSHK